MFLLEIIAIKKKRGKKGGGGGGGGCLFLVFVCLGFFVDTTGLS